MNRLKQHLTFANVVSCMALFIALGGGVAVAAGKIGPGAVRATNIANEAVTNPKLKKQAVTSGKIKDGNVNAVDLGTGSVINSKLAKKAVTNAKLGNESVGTSKLAKKSVTESTIGPEAVTAGKLGKESVSAAKLSASFYLQLLKNVTYISETSASNPEDSKSVTAVCPLGKEVLGGGVRINGANTKTVPTESSPAASAHLGWTAAGREIEPEAANWSVTAFAICAEL